MPWKTVNTMDLKMQLITDFETKSFSLTDLSQKYGISRPTAYKLIERYHQFGLEGLKEQSRAPKTCPHKTPEEIRCLMIKEKLKNRKRGPRKIRAQLIRRYPGLRFPATSAFHYWLKKEGLVEKRKKRLHVPPYTEPFSECKAPNDTWSIDYKGQFHMKNGYVCYPLTVSDNYTRYLLACKALSGPRHDPTKKCLEGIFREYGLPKAIRSDNGVPFAGKTTGGLSRLSIWFIQQGIIPERIGKGCPQENGRHERMHRTLKNEALDEIAKNLKDQQKSFDIFRHDYNNDRPHEALNDKTPEECYKKSHRPYVEQPRAPEYDRSYIVRRIKHCGEVNLMGRIFYVAHILAGQPIGIKEVADGIWQIQYYFYILGSIDLRKNKFIRK
jgi:transposase InsO family protein